MNLDKMKVIILTESSHSEQLTLNTLCRKFNVKMIVADVYGVFARVFNDFGP